MRKDLLKYTALVLLAATVTSCQKVIDVDLNSGDPKVVIEGGISDQPGPYHIRLTRTVNFDRPNEFPAISGASVRISDDAGNAEMLTETSPGIYTCSTLLGTPGRVYTLEVSADGEVYTSSSTLPDPVPIDSLTLEDALFGAGKTVNVHFRDPAGIVNYYRVIQVVNGVERKDIYGTDDKLLDGTEIQLTLFNQLEDSLVNGDTVDIRLQSIDKISFEYFRTLAQLTGSGGPPSDAPANPISGISNGALGYFTAYSVKSKRIIVR